MAPIQQTLLLEKLKLIITREQKILHRRGVVLRLLEMGLKAVNLNLAQVKVLVPA